MRLLLDTNAFLWLANEPDRIRDGPLQLLQDDRTQLLLSPVVTVEITIKVALGKLAMPPPPMTLMSLAADMRCTLLGITHADVLHAGSLPPIHGDPFDRLLVAQAQLLGVPVATADPVFARYGVETFSLGS